MEGKDLIKWLEELKISQKDLAVILDVSSNSVWRWANDKVSIPKTVEFALKTIEKEILEKRIQEAKTRLESSN